MARTGLYDTRAFSLLEMMMVVSLILILASFAMPIYRTIVVRAREAVLREDLFTLRSQIDRFTRDHERGPESLVARSAESLDLGLCGSKSRNWAYNSPACLGCAVWFYLTVSSSSPVGFYAVVGS